jgi:hypothetical protein
MQVRRKTLACHSLENGACNNEDVRWFDQEPPKTAMRVVNASATTNLRSTWER